MKFIKILLLIFCFSILQAYALDQMLEEKGLLKNLPDVKNNYLNFAINLGQNCYLAEFLDDEINVFQVINFALCNRLKAPASILDAKTNIDISELSSLSPAVKNEVNIIQQSNFIRNRELPSDNGNLTIGLLFDFYKKKAKKDTDNLSLTKIGNDYQLQKFVYDVIWFYCSMSFFKQDLEARIESEKFYQTIYQIANKKYGSKSSNLNDLLAARNDYYLSVMATENSRNDLVISRNNFLRILNLTELPWQENKKLPPPSIPKNFYQPDNSNSQPSIRQSLEDRPELKILTAKKRLTCLEIKTDELSNLPNIFLYAATKYDKNKHLIDQEIGEVGLKISFFLPDKAIDNYNIEKSRQEVKLNDRQKQLLTDKLALEADQQYQNFKITEEALISSEHLLDLALRNKNNNFNNYNHGRAAISKILDSEKKYYQAQRQRNILQYQKFMIWAFLFLGL